MREAYLRQGALCCFRCPRGAQGESERLRAVYGPRYGPLQFGRSSRNRSSDNLLLLAQALQEVLYSPRNVGRTSHIITRTGAAPARPLCHDVLGGTASL